MFVSHQRVHAPPGEERTLTWKVRTMRRTILLFVAIALMLAMVGTPAAATPPETALGSGAASSDGAMSPG
jgi:hypothetical protein